MFCSVMPPNLASSLENMQRSSNMKMLALIGDVASLFECLQLDSLIMVVKFIAFLNRQ